MKFYVMTIHEDETIPTYWGHMSDVPTDYGTWLSFEDATPYDTPEEAKMALDMEVPNRYTPQEHWIVAR